MEYDSAKDTNEHINKVRTFIMIFVEELIQRYETHDRSKLESPEKEWFDKYTLVLKETTYGSEKYKKHLEELKVALKHHYKNNRHHPEHFFNGIKGMNLIDLVEMFCDWVAATKRHDDGDIYKSIEINQERFGYSDDIKCLFENTVRVLGD